MSKNLSANHYQENKERLQKQLLKDIKSFQGRKRKKRQYGFMLQKSEDEKQKPVE